MADAGAASFVLSTVAVRGTQHRPVADLAQHLSPRLCLSRLHKRINFVITVNSSLLNNRKLVPRVICVYKELRLALTKYIDRIGCRNFDNILSVHDPARVVCFDRLVDVLGSYADQSDTSVETGCCSSVSKV